MVQTKKYPSRTRGLNRIFFTTIAMLAGGFACLAIGAENSGVSSATGTSAASAYTIRYACSLHNMQRRIEVDYFSTSASVPCEVNYYKNMETPGGGKQTLWSSQSLEGYCEQKAQSLMNKLSGFGWNCLIL